MFCPECGVEFEDDVSVCADCEVALVDGNGEDEEEDGEMSFAPLVESMDVGFFSMVTSRLEEAGIPWFVQGEESLGVLPRDGRSAKEPGAQVAMVYVAAHRSADAWELVESLDPVE